MVVVLIVAVVAVVAYASARPDSFRVQRSASIKAPPEKIFSLINDYRNWPQWSPYEARERAMRAANGLDVFCHKVLIALHENGTAFTPQIVDLGDAEQRAAFHALWPVGKFPVLQDSARGETVPELSIIIEYLDQHYPGKARFMKRYPNPYNEDGEIEIRQFFELEDFGESPAVDQHKALGEQLAAQKK